MEPKKIIAIFVIAAIAAAAIGFGAMYFLSEKDPNGYYNFSGKTADSYETNLGIIIPAPEDKQFYIAEITVRNDSYEPGLNTTMLNWKVTIDKMSFNMHMLHTEASKDFINTTFEMGKLWRYSVIFEIPKTITMNEITMGYSYISTEKSPDLRFDSNLKLPDPKTTNAGMIALTSRF